MKLLKLLKAILLHAVAFRLMPRRYVPGYCGLAMPATVILVDQDCERPLSDVPTDDREKSRRRQSVLSHRRCAS
jgi:hypothetical protein